MEIKITLDISDRLNAAIALIASALQTKTVTTAPEKATDLRVETPEPVDVSEPVPSPENVTDAKTDATAPAIAEPSAEPVKPKRSHKKADAPKADAPKAEPAPETTEQLAEPEPVEAPKDEPAEAPKDEPEPVSEPADATTMTLDEIRAVCVQAAKAGKTSVVTGYLNAHGAASLSKLDPALYAKLADTVKAAL